ncbi:hypothetical protein GN956_G282 [Arapaima gigas]
MEQEGERKAELKEEPDGAPRPQQGAQVESSGTRGAAAQCPGIDTDRGQRVGRTACRISSRRLWRCLSISSLKLNGVMMASRWKPAADPVL